MTIPVQNLNDSSATPHVIQCRAFLVGCPRSGTTLLQSMLAAHPMIKSFPETHFFNRLIGWENERFFGIKATNLFERLNRYRTSIRVWLGLVLRMSTKKHAWEIIMQLSESNILSVPFKSISMNMHVQTYIKFLDMTSLKDGKSMWVEKTPNHLHYIQEIQKYVADAKFIHILRRGTDNIASLYDAAQHYPDEHWTVYSSIGHAIRRWNISIKDSLRYKGNSNHYFVRYEELVRDPENILRGVCRFLEVEFNFKMINEYGNAAKGLVQNEERWKDGNFSGIRATSGTKFNELFDQQQQQFITNALMYWPE